MGELIIEYKETVDSNCTLPVLTSSKTEGVLLQEEHFGRKQQHDISGYNVLPKNYCTYRNRSDGIDFTFNVNKCCDKGIISKFYPVFYGNNSDTFFISLVLNNSNEVIREIGYTCIGTGQKVLSFSDLKNMNIQVPTYDEQRRVSIYFEKLDDLITLHQCKCLFFDKMEIFTWEQRKFGDVFEEYVEKNHLEFPVLTLIQGGGTVKRDEAERNILYAKSSLVGYKLVQKNDFILHLRSFEGGLERATCTGLISPAYHTFHGIKADSRFYYAFFRSHNFINRKLVPYIYGIRDGKSIDVEGMKSIEIPNPKLQEQRKIGDYINALDTLITLHQQK